VIDKRTGKARTTRPVRLPTSSKGRTQVVRED